MKHHIALMLFLFFLFISTLPLSALDFPPGPVILTISGLISKSNQAGQVELDAAMLKSLPQKQIETETPWTDGLVTFKGPLLRDVLKMVGAKGTILRATALNDYFIDIPLLDADQFDVILAMQINNEEMTVRTKGPLWVIYPWKENEELRSETFYSRSIWQLRYINVR